MIISKSSMLSASRLLGLLFIAGIATANEAPIEEQTFDCMLKPNMVIKVGSSAQGIIDRVYVKRGDSIEKGQTLVSLDSELERIAIELSQQRLVLLGDQLKRLEKLKTNNLVSLELYEQTKFEYDMADLDLKKNKLLLNRNQIKSQVKGVVVENLLSPGEYAYEQSPIVEIAKMDPLNVEVLLPISYYPDLSIGQTADLEVLAPLNQHYVAKVEVVDRVMDAASGTFGVRLSLANPTLDIPAGLMCRVSFNSVSVAKSE